MVSPSPEQARVTLPPTKRRTVPMARIAAAVWAAMMLGGLAIGAFGSESWRHSLAHEGPGCPFRRITSVDCPFCGMTRATLAMGDGDWSTAFSFHPFAPLVLFGMLALMAIIIVGRVDVLLRGRRPLYLLGSIIAIWILRLVI